MTKRCSICVVGSANIDLTFRTARLPHPGETVAGQSMTTGMGGKGANQAVAAARIGAKVTFVARVGDDAYGMEAIRAYEAEDIDTRFVRKDQRLPTGTAAIVVDDQAENCIIVVSGANASLRPEDVSEALPAIRSADAVVSQLETPLDATFEAFRLARSLNVRTVLTPAPARELPDELLRLCDLCVPNKSEAELLTGIAITNARDARTAADRLRTRGVGTVVVTMGSDGVIVVDDSGATAVPALNVTAVDPTGAGDAFTAALAVFLSAGLPVLEAARQATIVAALTVTRHGAQAAFPRLAEIDEFIGLNPAANRLFAAKPPLKQR